MNTYLGGLWHFSQKFSVEMLVPNVYYGSLTIGDKAVHQKVWQRQLSHRLMSSLRNRTSVTGLICTASRNPG